MQWNKPIPQIHPYFSYYFGEGRIKKRFEEYHILGHFLWMENSQSTIILKPLRDMVMNSKSLRHEEKIQI